jgi:beta-galactosidase
MQMAVPREFNEMQWFGRGSHESMEDRKESAAVGLYSGKVENLIHNYARPQENANRTDVRWMRLVNDEGEGLLFVANGEELLNTSAWPYTMEDLETAQHIHELPRRETNTVNIDYKQRGVGGDSFVFPVVHKEYKLLKGKEYVYCFRITPLKPGTKDVKALVKYRLPDA